MPGKRLRRDERVQIQTLWEEGYTYEQIGQRINRPRCTVWREVDRNNSYRHGPRNPLGQRLPTGRRGGYRWGYDAGFAQRHADQRTYRPKKRKCAPGTDPRRPGEPGAFAAAVPPLGMTGRDTFHRFAPGWGEELLDRMA